MPPILRVKTEVYFPHREVLSAQWMTCLCAAAWWDFMGWESPEAARHDGLAILRLIQPPGRLLVERSGMPDGAQGSETAKLRSF
jgi:hypothetical protein